MESFEGTTMNTRLPKTLLFALFVAGTASLHAEDAAGYLVGQVTSVSPAEHTLQIDGRTIYQVPHTTRFGGDTNASALQDVREGMWIRYRHDASQRGLPILEDPTLFTTPQE